MTRSRTRRTLPHAVYRIPFCESVRKRIPKARYSCQ